jgi:2-dehydro-3-deoxyphosphogluconate aldolase/(4S)-4-hydroxy-2-oxoglutarate aldolase
MAKFSRMDVLNNVIETGLVPIFYHADADVTRKVVAACVEGGVRGVEFTNRGDSALNVFSDVIQYFGKGDSRVILGAGTIVDAPTAAAYLNLGANFVVAPSFNPEVAKVCNRRKVAYMPGCATVTEINNAEEYGVEIVKVFPGDSAGGPSFVKTVLGPCPWSRMMITGGVEANEASVTAWFKAGVTAIGIGSDLIRKEYLAAGNYDAISERVAQVLGWIKAAKGG